MKKGDKAIVVNDAGELLQPGEEVTIIDKEDNSAIPYHVKNKNELTQWMCEDELRPVEKIGNETKLREDEEILFVRLYDGMWETNVENLVVIHDEIALRPFETSGRVIYVGGSPIYLNDQEAHAYNKSMEMLRETTISTVEIPLSDGKLFVSKDSITWKND